MSAEGSQSGLTDAHLTFVTLGGWGVSAPTTSAPAPQLGPSKPLALLVYLALSPGRAAAREHLLDLLWADLEPAAATHAYRQTIWYIRQRLGEACLKVGGNQLTLVAPAQTDRDAFLAAVESQNWERAVALYTGDFLPGFAAPGGAEFEQWADLERWRLRGLFCRAGEALARRHLATGHAREAVTLAHRVRDADRSAEPGWRLLLEALLASGDPVGAAVEADGLERMLRDDARDAEPATRALLRAARQEPQTESPNEAAPRGLVAELVGREKEFGAIVAAWDAARHGASRHIHIIGAAGLGKSRLLGDALTRLKASGARTVLVRAAPGERALSYALAADLAVALAAQAGSAAVSSTAAGTLVGLSPVLGGRYPSAEPDRSVGDEVLRRRVLATAELLAAVADESPLALLIDDVHWMDPHSRQLVSALIGRLGRSPALVVTTARPTPEGALDNGDTERLTLEPLSEPQVGALVASFGSLPDTAWARTLPRRLRATAKGSPLIVLETLELAIERGILELGAAGWRCGSPDDLERLLAGGAALRQRLERLTREQRWLLLVLAVHGTSSPLELLRAAAPRSDDALQSDLLLLEQRGLVSREQGEWQPAHDAIAELAIELGPQAAVQAAHAALGRALASSTNDPATLPRAAQHLAAAGDGEALNLVFRRWVRAARSRADRRPLRSLAQELLGHETNGRADALVRALPLRLRLGLVTPARVAAVAAALVLVAAGLGSRILAHNEVAIRLVALVPDGDGLRPIQVDVRDEDLTNQRTIDVSKGARAPDLPARISPRPLEVRYLGSGLWTLRRNTGEPNVEEPTILGRSALPAFPPAPGDDAARSASPDGKFVAVYTDRWSASNAGDVGVFDLATGTLRQLTSGPTRDMPGPWSPDGTRIAFERHRYDQKPPELCWVTFDGRRLSCFAPPAWSFVYITGGWISPHEILALGLDSTGRQSVYSVDLDARSSKWLFDASQAWGLPNSPWVICACAGKSGGDQELQLRRVDVPGRAIRVAGAGSLLQLPIAALPLTGAASAPGYLDRLTIAGPPDGTAAPGVPFRYAAAGVLARPARQWTCRCSIGVPRTRPSRRSTRTGS